MALIETSSKLKTTSLVQPPRRIAAIGELLWDLLPGGPQLGGAPANFCAMFASLASAPGADFSDEVFLVTCVGHDSLGTQALHQLAQHHVRLDCVSTDPMHPTGSVAVDLHVEAGPTYSIQENVAWDFLPETVAMTALAPTLDAICFGTLAQRCPATRLTLRKFVGASRPGCMRVFDVNLREPYWTRQAIAWGCSHATILKMNHEEVPLVAQAVDCPRSQQGPLQVARFLLGRFPVNIVAITRGEHGSLLVTREGVHDHPGIASKIADPIGAGDAFTAALTLWALRELPLPLVAEAANHWGAWVAGQRGGMPFLDEITQRKVEAAIEAAGAASGYLPRED